MAVEEQSRRWWLWKMVNGRSWESSRIMWGERERGQEGEGRAAAERVEGMNLKRRTEERNTVRGEKSGVSLVFKVDEVLYFICSALKIMTNSCGIVVRPTWSLIVWDKLYDLFSESFLLFRIFWMIFLPVLWEMINLGLFNQWFFKPLFLWITKYH